MSSDSELREKLTRAGQEHVLRYWDELSESERHSLQRQLEDVDLPLIQELAAQLLEPDDGETPKLEPAPVVQERGLDAQRLAAAKERGEAALREGRVAAFVVAGGQGTRLGYPGPKGCFEITPVHGKSLFQWHAEKIAATSQRYGKTVPWIVMTSQANDEETREFFERNRYFGLASDDVHFICQAMMPAVGHDGKLLLADRGELFWSPNGHGGSLLALRASGTLDQLKERGVEEIFYFQVDNPLLRMLDPLFIGLHIEEQAEMSSKVVPKRSPDEKVGVVGLKGGRFGVIEYSDLTTEQMEERDERGELRYNAGNIAIHMIRRDFVERLTHGGAFELPYHKAHKKIPHVNEAGQRVEPTEPNGYKFETFVFDALGYAKHSVTLEVPRELEFAPVKNAEGDDSPETSKEALTTLFKSWVEASGLDVDVQKAAAVEIAPSVALDQDHFKDRVQKGEVTEKDVSIA